MSKKPKENTLEQRTGPVTGSGQKSHLCRRDALAKLGKFASAGYMAPALLTLLVSKKASAASGAPPLPPGE